MTEGDDANLHKDRRLNVEGKTSHQGSCAMAKIQTFVVRITDSCRNIVKNCSCDT